MLPGPFQAPPFQGIPSYISPLVMWLLILGAAVAVVITLFRFLVAEREERINSLLVFLLTLVLIFVAYFALMNGPEIAAWFKRVVQR